MLRGNDLNVSNSEQGVNVRAGGLEQRRYGEHDTFPPELQIEVGQAVLRCGLQASDPVDSQVLLDDVSVSQVASTLGLSRRSFPHLALAPRA